MLKKNKKGRNYNTHINENEEENRMEGYKINEDENKRGSDETR